MIVISKYFYLLLTLIAFTSSIFQVAAFRSMVNIITRYLAFPTIVPNLYKSPMHGDALIYLQGH